MYVLYTYMLEYIIINSFRILKMTGGPLLAFDFDHTIVNLNTDVEVNIFSLTTIFIFYSLNIVISEKTVH